MFKKITKTVLISVFCAIFSLSAAAWDDVGHKTTAFIAWRQMSPQARERAAKLLREAPEDSDLSVYFMGDARPLAVRQLEHFMIASTWADIVRDRDFKVRYGKYHKGNWHYYDTFWTTENGQVKILENPNEDGGKALEKLMEFEKVLRDASAKDEDKAIALAWILHLAGDIHQPLHNSARITELEPKGDQGGNLFLLTPQGTPRDKQENLHWFWDSIVVRNMPRGETCDSEFISKLAEKITKKYPAAKMQNRVNADYNIWHKEGLQLAQTKVFTDSLKRFEMPSADYKKEALKVSEEQLALAGYRMGALLNDVFGGAAVVAANETCKVIRRVPYPVTKTNDPKNPQKNEIALLDLCPANRGMVARPMLASMENGRSVMREYDVVKVFKNAAEARKYAGENNIADVSF